jgi:hypothetical protein
VHYPAERQGGDVEEDDATGCGAGAEDAAAGGRGAAAGVAAAVAAERGGAGERERAGGDHVLVQVWEQGRRGCRHLRQPGQGRLRPRRRRAGQPVSLSTPWPKRAVLDLHLPLGSHNFLCLLKRI